MYRFLCNRVYSFLQSNFGANFCDTRVVYVCDLNQTTTPTVENVAHPKGFMSLILALHVRYILTLFRTANRPLQSNDTR